MGQSTGMAWAEAIDRNVVLRVERTVAAIRDRIRCATDDEVATHARGDLHRLTGAVDGVLRLHAPTEGGCCRGCSPYRRRRYRRLRRRGPGGGRRWPCATLRTVTRAIDSTVDIQ